MSVVSQSHDHLLRRTLYGNAAFSVVSGAVLAIFAGTLVRVSVAASDTWLGSALGTVVLLLGLGVIGFGAICWFIASRPQMPVWLARVILWADIGWVAGSALVLVLGASALTGWGLALVIAPALVVADLAIFEWLGLRRMAA
ncbi:MAG: hypothetical protein JO055_06600 [Alphaproteobacteria bacterium]|nr:hypothetical protein [Alphaproteobacteria bacterium]